MGSQKGMSFIGTKEEGLVEQVLIKGQVEWVLKT